MTHNKKVIKFLESEGWRFYDFIAPSGANPIEDWYQSDLSEYAKYLLSKILKDNRKTDNHLDWGGIRGLLKGKKYKKYRIWEFGFFADGRQYRLFFVFGPERRQTTLLAGCYHKAKRYTPADALNQALERAKMLERGEGARRERKTPIDR